MIQAINQLEQLARKKDIDNLLLSDGTESRTKEDWYAINKALDHKLTFQRLRDYIKQYNSGKPLSKQVRKSVVHTAEKMMGLYLKQLHKGFKLDPKNFASDGELPLFKTCNTSLATLMDTTPKTIHNHRKRLVEAGIIVVQVNRVHHGISIQFAGEIISVPNRKNLPPLVHVVLAQDINKNSDVDNSDGLERSRPTPSSATVCYASGTTCKNTAQSAQPSLEKQEKQEKNKPARAKNTVLSGMSSSPNGSNEPSGFGAQQSKGKKEARKAFQRHNVNEFWEYAKNILWPHRYYDAEEERVIKNLIFETVFRCFKNIDDAMVKKFQNSLRKRIDMASKWLSYKEYRYVPEPKVYFSLNNKGGFHNTDQWLKAEKQKRYREYLRRTGLRERKEIIDKIDQQWDQHRRGIGRFKEKTKLEIYQIFQKRVSLKNDPILDKMFIECVHRNTKKDNLKTYYA